MAHEEDQAEAVRKRVERVDTEADEEQGGGRPEMVLEEDKQVGVTHATTLAMSHSTVSTPMEGSPRGSTEKKKATLYGVDRPFFHIDLHDAVEAAAQDARSKDRVVIADASSETTTTANE